MGPRAVVHKVLCGFVGLFLSAPVVPRSPIYAGQ